MLVVALCCVPPASGAEDPQAAVIAEGEYLYRQRDLDALMMIARRHLGRPFQGDEEATVEDTITRMLVAREDLLRGIAALPPAFSASQRDRLVLDILDYQAEPRGGAVAGPPVAAPAAAGPPVMVELPAIDLQRPASDGSAIHLRLRAALALTPGDAALLEPHLLLIQDAVLASLHGLERTAFAALDLETTRSLIATALAGTNTGIPVGRIQVLITEFSREP